MNSSYERIYGAGLLDDLHNYFPALLYEPSTFSNIRDVLMYVQLQTRNRFDLFSVGASRFYSQQPLRPAPQTRVPEPVQPELPIPPIRIHYDEVNNILISTLLRGVFQDEVGMTSVIVHPTTQQITAATTESLYESGLVDGPICSICQDTVQMRDQIRRINHCQHIFHKNCIDVWFQSNVRCPVCRHDIRALIVRPSE